MEDQASGTPESQVLNNNVHVAGYTGAGELLDNSRFLSRYNQDIASFILKGYEDFSGKSLPSLVKDKNVPCILDFGAGIGTISHAMLNLGVSADYICVEPDSFLRKQISPAIRAFDSLESASISGRVDLAFSANVLEHIEHDVDTLIKLRNCLASKGILILYVPALPILWTRMDTHVGHFRRYTKQSLSEVVTSAGFRVLRISYVDSAGAIATLAFKTLEMCRSTSTYHPPSANALKLFDSVVWPISKYIDPLLKDTFGKNLIMVADYNDL